MKRKILFAGAFVLLAWAASSCEALKTCKVCKQVTYYLGSVDNVGSEQEYCDTDLIAIEATPDFVSGDYRTAWECH